MASVKDSLSGLGDGGTTQISTLAPEPIEGNSLTRYLRSINNRQGQVGNQAFNAGSGLLQQGGGIIDKSLSTFQQPLDYWSALLSGDPTATAKAIGPTATAVGKQYDNASRAASTLLPRGGYRSTMQAELPSEKASTISQAILGLQPQAAQQVSGIAGLLGQLGLNTGQLGLGEQGLGSSIIGQLLQSLLTGRGQDVNEHGQAMGLAGQLAAPVANVGAQLGGAGAVKALGWG